MENPKAGPSNSQPAGEDPDEGKPFWQRLKSDFKKVPRKKVVIVGDDRCGKTSLALCFHKQKQDRMLCQNYVATVFENSLATMELEENQKIELALWDTAGREKFDSLVLIDRPLCYVKCDVLLMCYSVDSVESMQSILPRWEPEAARYCPEALIVLVGLKTDLRDDRKAVAVADGDAQQMHSNRPESPTMVTSEQGQLLAEIIEAFGFAECSVKNNTGVDDVIRMVTNAAFCKVKNKSGRKQRNSISNTISNNTSEDAENTPTSSYGCCNFFGL